MKRVLFATVGVDRDTVRSIVFSVDELNPDAVVLLATPESRRKLGDAIVRRLSGGVWESEGPLDGRSLVISGGRYRGLELDFPEVSEDAEPNDAEALQLEYEEVIRQKLRDMEAPRAHAVADFTSGTKPMAAALYAAAYTSGISRLNYVTGERGEDGEVVDGTEESYIVRGRKLRHREKLASAVELFNERHYEAARGALDGIDPSVETLLPYGGRAVVMVRAASKAFAAWDRFHFDDALTALTDLGGDDRVEPEFLGEHLMTKRLRERRVQRHLAEAREQQSADAPTYLGLVADLIANADRRVDRDDHDDAIARLYRALEYLAQLRIYGEYGLRTDEFPTGELPESRRPPGSEQSTSIGLTTAWRFLADRGDEVGESWLRKFEDDSTGLRTAMQQRNHSLLAHGFQPVHSDYVESLREAVVDLVLEGWDAQSFERMLEACRFREIVGLLGEA